MSTRLGRTKAFLIASTLLMGSGVLHAENIPAEELRGYERWHTKDPYEEEEERLAKLQAEKLAKEQEAKKNGKTINVEISFYTSLIEENSSLGGIDAQGNPLVWGTIAVPRSVALGTKFEIQGYEGTTFVARDRGSVKHIRIKEDGTYRIDMFIPRQSGENDNQYWLRVNNLGKVKTTALMYNV